MTSRPTRSTVAGRAYLDLQNLARRTRRPTDELHQIYALEGFLDRLTHSPHAEKLVLKGGVLLAAYDARRPMVYAEKLVTAVDRADANTRWRDFADVYLLSRRHDVDGIELTTAIQKVAAYRGVLLAPLRETLNAFAALAQPRWAGWRRKHNLADRLPQEFGAVLDHVIAFADPVLAGSAAGEVWVALDGEWVQAGAGR